MKIKYCLILFGTLLLPGIAFWLIWPESGLSAQYRVVRRNKVAPCAKSIDHEIYFLKKEQFHAPVMERWKSSKHGSNKKLRKLDVVWEGFLRVPEDGEYRFHSETNGDFSITVGDAAKQIKITADFHAIPLSKGIHSFHAHYVGIKGPRLSWARSDNEYSPVGWSHFYRSKPIPFARTAAIIVFALLICLQCLLLRRLAPNRRGDLISFVDDHKVVLALMALLALTFATRFYRYDRMPFPLETRDEFSVTLDGMNLVTKGVPSSWSLLDAYKNDQKDKRKLFGAFFPVVRPYFDQPPAFDYLVGLYLRLCGAKYKDRYQRLFTKESRQVLIAIAVINALLLYFFAKRVLKHRGDAMLAVLFFAIYPTAAVGGRLVKAENAIMTFMLGSLLLTMRYLDSKNRKILILTAIVAGFSCWFKVSGMAVIGGVAAVLLLERHWKAAFFVGAAGLAIFGLFFAWGAFYDWDTFIAVFKSHEARSINGGGGLTLSTRGLWSLIAFSGPVKNKLFSLTHLWLWLSVVLLWYDQTGKAPTQRLRYKPLVWPPVIYLVFMALTIGSNKSFCWYRTPLIPFMAVAAAWYIRRMITDGSALMAAVFCLVPFTDALYWGVLAPATEHRMAFRLAMIGSVGLVLLSQTLPEKYSRPAVRGLSAVAVVITFIFMTISLNRYWYIYTLSF